MNIKLELSPENVQHHCRTCLIYLLSDAVASQKVVNLSQNTVLQRLIAVNIEDTLDPSWKLQSEYPQNICFSCHKQLREFLEFCLKAQQSAQILQALFSNSSYNEPTNVKVEVPVKKKRGQRPKEIKESPDALEESQTVLLPNAKKLPELAPLPEAVKDPISADLMELDELEPKIEKIELKTEENLIIKKENTLSTNSDSDPIDDDAVPETFTSKANKGSTPSKESTRKPGIKRSNRRGAAFRCEECGKRFVRKPYYDAHILEVHQGTTHPYACDQCDKFYKSFTSLNYHKHMIHKLKGKTFQCDQCDKNYRSEATLRYHHMRAHLGHVFPKRCICEHCGAIFAHSSSLDAHIKQKHRTSKTQMEYKCEICKRSFHTPYTLNYHHLREHAAEKPCVCDTCGMAFAKKFMLASHLRSHVSDAEKLPCSQCDKRFINEKEVEKHVRMVHMKIKPHICSYCGESFGTPKTLKHHVYIHTGEKPYVCDVCGQGFRQPTAMKTHRNTHLKESGMK